MPQPSQTPTPTPAPLHYGSFASTSQSLSLGRSSSKLGSIKRIAAVNKITTGSMFRLN